MSAISQTASLHAPASQMAEWQVRQANNGQMNVKNFAGNSNKIKEVAQDFESMFLGQMLQHMFETVEKPALFDGGHAEEMYQSLLTDEYAKQVAARGGIGIAAHVERQLLSLQEVSA